MKLKNLLKTKLLPVTAGAVVVALAAGGVAYASTPSTTSSPASVTGAAAASATVKAAGLRADVRWLARHTIHAQLIVRTKAGFETVTIDKGKLDTDSSTTITITRADHVNVSATIRSSTKFVGLSESQLGSGDGVVLVQHAGYALYVAARAPTSASNSNG
ncbi:MAG: hypothetical protein WAL04_07340 [Acidimicrobiales bacterium]